MILKTNSFASTGDVNLSMPWSSSTGAAVVGASVVVSQSRRISTWYFTWMFNSSVVSGITYNHSKAILASDTAVFDADFVVATIEQSCLISRTCDLVQMEVT